MIYTYDDVKDKIPVMVIADGVKIERVLSVDINLGVIIHCPIGEDGCVKKNEKGDEVANESMRASGIQMIDKYGNVFAELKK